MLARTYSYSRARNTGEVVKQFAAKYRGGGKRKKSIIRHQVIKMVWVLVFL